MITRPDLGAPGRWFPPERGPVLIIGNPDSVFTRHLARLWRRMGIDAQLITRQPPGAGEDTGGIPLHVTSKSESRRRAAFYRAVERATWTVESRLVAMQEQRYRAAMGSETWYRPYVSPCVADALGIAAAVRELRPQFVCGQEVFAYGLATALCRGVPRVLMPWGGDIYMYANTTSLASAAVGLALTHVELVVAGSPIARDYLRRRFGVAPDRIHCEGLWALDRTLFRRADSAERQAICARYGIDPGALVVMNVRRFFPAWGSDLALESSIRFARENPSAHFIFLGGVGTERFVSEARELLRRAGLLDRFTLFDGAIPLEECAALMSVADISLSLMRETDNRPLAAVLEAAATGSAVILGDQPEYRAMERLGFQAAFCPPGDVTAVVAALRRFAADDALRGATYARNLAYLDEHENGERQALRLLERVRSLVPRS